MVKAAVVLLCITIGAVMGLGLGLSMKEGANVEQWERHVSLDALTVGTCQWMGGARTAVTVEARDRMWARYGFTGVGVEALNMEGP